MARWRWALMLLGAMPMTAQTPRLMGVYSATSGEPIAGVEVLDVASKTSARTTATGTVTLSFLPSGTSLVRVRKLGYEPFTTVVSMSPTDTLPITVLLKPTVQTLPTVVSKDSAPKHISPGLRDFEERRRSGIHGSFVGEAEMRKQDDKRVTWFVRRDRALRRREHSIAVQQDRLGMWRVVVVAARAVIVSDDRSPAARSR